MNHDFIKENNNNGKNGKGKNWYTTYKTDGKQNPCPFWVIIPPVNPLDDYSYTPPYTSPTISLLLPHYQYQYRNNRLPHPYKRIIPILPTTIPQISPLLPHYQDQYRNNQLPHPYSLRWYYHPKVGKGSLIDFTRFSFKGYNHDILIVQCLLYSMFIIYLWMHYPI